MTQFDLNSAMAVKEREDGLLEKDGFDLSTARPIPELRAAKPGEFKYSPPLTEAQKAQSVVAQVYGEYKKVPELLKWDWNLTSPQAQAATGAAVTTAITGGLNLAVQGIRGLAEKGGKGDPLDRIFKGIVYPEATARLYERLPGTKDLPKWAEITAGIAEDIIAYGTTALVKGKVKTALLLKDINRKIDTAATAYAKDKMKDFLPAGQKTEQSVLEGYKNKFKSDFLKKANAIEAELVSSETIIGESQPGGASRLQEYASRRSLLGLIIEDLQHTKAGVLRVPSVGQTVGFKNPQGEILTGTIKKVLGEVAEIELLNQPGRIIVATLSQLSIPEVSEPIEEMVSEKQYISPLQKKIDAMKEREEKVDYAKYQLEEGIKIEESLKGRIKPFKGEFLSEELQDLPSIYKAKTGGIDINEAIQELSGEGLGTFENEQDLIDYLKRWQEEKKYLKRTIEENKPKMVTKKETTLLQQKIKDVEMGMRAGEVKTKKEIGAIQTSLISILEDMGLESKDKAKFLSTIKNIQTSEQLERTVGEFSTRATRLAEKAEKGELVRKIQSMERADVPVDYREQIDSLLEDYDLKPRTEKTKRIREKRSEFLARARTSGDIDFLPADFFADLGKKTLDEMTVAEVQDIHDQIAILTHVGKTKNKLLARKEIADLEKQVEKTTQKIYDFVGKKEEFLPDQPLVSGRHEGAVEKLKNTFSGYFAQHRKVEFLTREFGIYDEIFETIHRGLNEEKVIGEQVYKELKDAMKLIGKNTRSFLTEPVKLPNIPVELTREQMVTIALNSGNEGNLKRLIEGNKFTEEQIQIINDALTLEEKQFVDKIHAVFDSLYPKIKEVSEKITGLKLGKVEGKYFPIVVDKELNKMAQFREESENLFQDVFLTTFLSHSFTHTREGGRAPIDLNGMGIIFNHIDKVIHYNSLALPVRDVQKIIKHPRFEKALTDSMNEYVYREFPLWLRDIANPGNIKGRGELDKIASFLRHNATAAILGQKISVSLLQGGSYTQTIEQIGLPSALGGVVDFLKNPARAVEFIYSKSPIMKHRSETWDREIKDFLQREKMNKMISGKSTWAEILFSMIRGVDFITTMPTWLGAYNKAFEASKDELASIEYADSIVRRTQPTGAIENLPSMMRGAPMQKLWTSFMTHFTNMHNLMVDAMDQMKYGKDHPMRKSANFARSMFWLWVAPTVLAAYIRSGGKLDPKKALQEFLAYPTSGLFLIRDITNALVKGYDIGAPPAFAGIKEAIWFARGKKPKTKLNHGLKAVGLLTGTIPIQYVDSLIGFIDMMNGETKDFRRLFWSESALKVSGEKKSRRGSSRRGSSKRKRGSS